MTEHVHFNTDDVRAAHRSAIDQMREQLAAGSYSAEQMKSHELTLDLSNVLLEVTVACFDARNGGTSERAIAMALATALGNAAGNYMVQIMLQHPALALPFYDRMSSTISRHMGDDDKGTIHGVATVYPMQGSRA